MYRVQLRSFHLPQPPDFQWDMSPSVAVEPTDVKQYIGSGKVPVEGWKWSVWWKTLTQSSMSFGHLTTQTKHIPSTWNMCVTMCHLHPTSHHHFFFPHLPQSYPFQPLPPFKGIRIPPPEVACNSFAQAFLSKASRASKSQGSARRIRKVLRCKCWFSIRQ